MAQPGRYGIWWTAIACALLVAPAAADEAGDSYAVAAGHYSAHRWKFAVEEFTTFLDDFPTHEHANDARFYLGESLVQLGRFDDARARFRELLAGKPDGRYASQALFRSGEAAYLSGKLDEAKEDLESFYGQYKEDRLRAFVLPYLGEISLATNDAPAAQKYFAEALKEFPEGALQHDCRFGLAQALEKQGRLTEAGRLYAKLSEDADNPLADRAYFRRGLFDYRAGKYREALQIWESFSKQFPKSKLQSRVDLGRGWALYRLDRFAEAEEVLGTLVRDESVGIESQYWLGLTLRAQHKWKTAAETLIAAANADQKHRLLSAIRFHAGDSLLHTGDRRGAVRQFDLLLHDSPKSKWADDSLFGKVQAALEVQNHAEVDRLARQFEEQYASSSLRPEVQLLRAAALMELEKFADAVDALHDYLAADPDTTREPIARGQLVVCYCRLQKLNQARAAYEELVARHPKHRVVPPTTHHLAETAYEAGDRKWAAELFESLTAEGNPPEFVAKGLSGLGWSRLKADDSEGSSVLFERLLKEYPKSPLAAEAAVIRGQIFEQKGQADAALSLYHLVIQEYPDSDEVAEALLRAARIHDGLAQDQQAATLYERLIKEQPKFKQIDAAIYGLAWVMIELGSSEAAYENFERIHRDFRESPYWSDSTYRLADHAGTDDKFEHAGQLLEELIEASPEPDILGHALYLQGRLAWRRELWEEVEPPMTRLVEELPESPLRMPAEYAIAEAAYRQMRFDQASELLDKLAKQIEGRHEDWLAMIPLRQAQVRAHQKSWDEALRIAKELKEEYPQFPRLYEADYVIGRSLSAQGQFDKAREAYRRVIRSPQGSKTETAAMAQWMIGESYFHQKDYDQARREYLRTEILYAYPQWQAGALLQAGKCHEQQGQWQAAAELYIRLLKNHPDTSYTEESTRRLRIVEQRAASEVAGPRG